MHVYCSAFSRENVSVLVKTPVKFPANESSDFGLGPTPPIESIFRGETWMCWRYFVKCFFKSWQYQVHNQKWFRSMSQNGFNVSIQVLS